MNTEDVIVLVNLVSTLALFGLIWTIQLVHYPTFTYIDAASFEQFSAFHQSRITWIVAPLMIAELATAVALLAMRPEWFPMWIAVAGAVLVAAVWLSTFFIQVPLHGKLNSGFDEDAIRLLVQTNWIRTFAWTGRSVLLWWVLIQRLGSTQA